MAPVEFEPTIPVVEWLQTFALGYVRRASDQRAHRFSRPLAWADKHMYVNGAVVRRSV